MKKRAEIKTAILSAIDNEAGRVLDIVKAVGAHPELGYREFGTARMVTDYLRYCGYEPEEGLALTGVKARLKKENVFPEIAVLGELDGVVCRESKSADPVTGATHSCGHHLQLGVLLLVAHAIKTQVDGNNLKGNISFFAVPSEEYIDLEYKQELKKQGKIFYFGGKQELIRLGAFDGVDAALMVHAGSNCPGAFIGTYISGNGFNGKQVRITGKAAHAAAFPEEGINALSAAVLGINAIHALREGFRDGDHDRIHYIITHGGENVNSIPSDVRLDAYVRSSTRSGIQKLSDKFERAFRAGGEAVGASTCIETQAGYLPLACNKELNDLFIRNAATLLPEKQILQSRHFMASTDMGDLSHLIPVIHPTAGGVTGSLHSAGFEVVDYIHAVVLPAKIVALTLVDLLTDCNGEIQELFGNYRPLLNKKEYLDLMNSYPVNQIYPGNENLK